MVDRKARASTASYLPRLGLALPSMETRPTRSEWIDTTTVAEHLKVHVQTVRKIRKLPDSPWVEGIHYRRTGLTNRGPIQWAKELAEDAFTGFRRTPAEKVETFSRVPNPVVR